MPEYSHLQVHYEDGIQTIIVSRPESLNALNVATMEEIREAIQNAYDSKEVKGVIITGDGDKSFVAGADIEEVSELNEVNGRKFSETGQEIFSLIENSEKPIIAAINGFALGGGCELAMACHLRIATKGSKFGQPEVNLGLIPGYGGTQRLTQLIGKGRAMELMLTGEQISAEEALDYGLINILVEDKEELKLKSKEIIDKIVSKAPKAVGMIINCVNAYFSDDENGFQTEANSFSSCCKTEDFKEGTSAFLEKRKPEFKGE